MKKIITILGFSLFMLGCSADTADTTKTQTTAQADIMYFGATWWGPCKKMKQLFQDQDVKKELDEIDFQQYDIDSRPDLAKKYNIRSIPTLITKSGQRYTGFLGKEKLLQILRKY